MNHLLLVMLGGALGAGLRHLFGRGTLALLGPNWPWGTLGVNLLGGFAMGLLVAALGRGVFDGLGGENARLLLGVGVLGGFTTFSAFSLDAVLMIERGELGGAALYVAASVLGSLVALFVGLSVARASA
ncbi:fluoride efflux transporter CrcB [Sphingomonas sp. ac-8]|uniref:fluoride efflux transporter CrcB n=1 Tax=Sphingomonas sp. ac-8 TaxID=3242977 RepID=UPI003A7F6475